MKRITLILFLVSSLLYCQSSITYDAGSSIDIGAGADVCADNIVVNGTFTGIGTFCNNPVDVENDSSGVPTEFSLSQNHPNPFNPATVISFRLPFAGQVSLKIFDVTGKEVAQLVTEPKPAGKYEVTWDAANHPSGVYFYQLHAGTFMQTKKMILMK